MKSVLRGLAMMGLAIMLLAACKVAPVETLPAITPVPAQLLDTGRTPSPILPTPDETLAQETLPPVVPLGLVRRWPAAPAGVQTAALVDVTGDEASEILAAAGDTLIVYDTDGSMLWQFTADAPLVALAGIELDGQPPQEVIAASDDLTLYALDSAGQILWATSTEKRAARLIAFEAGDSQGVLVALWGGGLLALDGQGGTLWESTATNNGDVTALALADTNGDDTPEIITGTERGIVAALDGAGQPVWILDAGAAVTALAVSDFDGGGRDELVVATRGGGLLLVEGDGSLRWQESLGLVTALAVSASGADQSRIIAASGPAPGHVFIVDEEGRLLRSAELSDGVLALAAQDVDGDGGLDVFAGLDGGGIALLDAFGRTRATYPTQGAVRELRLLASGASSPALLARSGQTLLYLNPAPGSDNSAASPAGPQTLSTAPANTFHPPGAGEAALVFAGDVFWPEPSPYGPTYPFEGLLEVLRGADVAIVNLDTVLSASSLPDSSSDPRRAAPGLASSLQLAGIDVAWLANLHALDYGQSGLDETLAALARANVAPVGAGADRDTALTPQIVETNGLRIAFVAFADDLPAGWAATNDGPGLAAAETARIAQTVRDASAQADVVVVGLHAAEGRASTAPNARQEALAQAAINAGATVVVMHGPDVVAQTVRYRNGLIAYGLGEFAGDGGAGALLRVVVGSEGIRTADVALVQQTPAGQGRLVTAEENLPAIERLIPPDVTFRAPSLNADPGTTPDVQLNVTLDYAAHRLDVVQAVTARNETDDSWSEVVFAVTPAFVENVFELYVVTVTRNSSQQTVEFEALEEGETFLRIDLPEPVGSGGWVTVELTYSLFPPVINPVDWQPYSTFGYDATLLQAGEWYPVLVPYVEGNGWTTWIFQPVGDPIIYTAADYTLDISAPPDVIIASGGQTGRDENEAATVWHFELDNARGLGFIASPTMRCVSREADGVTLRSCYQPEADVAGREALEVTEQAFTLFSELYGPYPHDDLVVVQNGYYGAMEYSAMLSITEPAYTFYNGFPDTLLVALLTHEIAHQWWYDVVGNNQVYEPWLDESLASYSELLYYEQYYPDLTAWWWNYRVLQYEPAGPVDANIYDHSATEPFVRNMYGQATFFIADMRRVMGDEAFFAFLRDYYASGAGQLMTADDFFEIARRHTDEDLSGLLRGYFRDANH